VSICKNVPITVFFPLNASTVFLLSAVCRDTTGSSGRDDMVRTVMLIRKELLDFKLSEAKK
jgi:hypothetical protein